MKTSTIKPSAPRWVVLDAAGQRIGKVAVKAAHLLKGKHRTTYSPHQLCGDHVIVLNVAKLELPPKKGLRKTFHRHTGYVGNMKHVRLDIMMEKKPTYVIEHAVKGMLPTSRLAQQMMRRLHVFIDDKHPYEAQQPISLPIR